MTIATQFVLQAQLDKIRFNIPEQAYQAFRSQCHRSKRRGIIMKFNLKEWWDWWQIDNNWSKRGKGKDQLVMARFKDKGPYAKDNVYCATNSQNSKDTVHQPRKKDPNAIFTMHFKGIVGDNHPRSIAVITPKGRFGSLNLASQAHNITRAYASMLAKLSKKGWHYE